jgi:membrane protein DedA with SNARE-associated domain
VSLAALLARYGYLAILIGSLLEGETIVVLGGFSAHRGYLSLPYVILAAFAGTVLGDQLYFQLGRRRGPRFLERRPRWRPTAERVQRMIRRHETAVILGFRFLYGIRSITPFVLGMTGVGTLRFALLNLVSAALWAAAMGAAGYALGAAIETLLGGLHRFETAVFVAILAVGAIAWSVHWLRSRSDAGPPPLESSDG